MTSKINAITTGAGGIEVTGDSSGEIEFQADGTTIATITSSGLDVASGLTFGSPIDIASGGTGQTTATASFNALAPSQAGNSGKYLTTNGTNTSWGTVAQYTLPSQTGNAGKYLTTDGTNESWGTVTVPTLTSDLTNDSGFITGNQTITLSGDATGSGTTSIVVTVADDSHNHIISNVDGLQTALDAKAPIASPTFTGTATTPNLQITSVASFGDGTAAAPSIANFGDLNTGLWFPAADTIAASTAGTERMRITSTGNVGIGTSSPSSGLEVYGTDAASGRIEVTRNTSSMYLGSSGAGGYIQTPDANPLLFYTNAAERMVINSSGNVGIGTSSPSRTLDVNGLTRFRFASGTGAGTWLDTVGNANRFFVGTDAATESWRVYDAVAGTQRLSLDSAGNLKFNSGYGSVATAYGCRAWVNFNGTGTVAIRASGNVSSITDNGVGDFSVNFATAMPDANYSTCGMGRNNNGQWGVSIHREIDPTSSVCRIRGQSDIQYGDSAFVMFAVFR